MYMRLIVVGTPAGSDRQASPAERQCLCHCRLRQVLHCSVEATPHKRRPSDCSARPATVASAPAGVPSTWHTDPASSFTAVAGLSTAAAGSSHFDSDEESSSTNHHHVATGDLRSQPGPHAPCTDGSTCLCGSSEALQRFLPSLPQQQEGGARRAEELRWAVAPARHRLSIYSYEPICIHLSYW
ncbi:hypothetical protein AVEN_77578-1 [Araneus ventricosus]|uniref:Uncharacterized protein n=1 Tax=Araneus ventricosus TaxID=182803 RepID=A0A4Y2R191_ARAVE|nr:hypothetical protein AVEN_77578-1 [Araneus ventricosus]